MTDIREAAAHDAASAHRAEPDRRLHLVRADDHRTQTAQRPSTTRSSGGTSVRALPEYQGYRMISTPDGGFAGGVLPINAEMQQHGARPIWLGYLNVDDVDQKVASIETAGGKALMGRPTSQMSDGSPWWPTRKVYPSM